MIAVIDYGAGNLQSVVKALDFIGCKSIVSSSRDELLKADGAILPGVGSFGDAVNSMISLNLKDAVIDFINSGKPFLGICLGLQLLFPESEESPGANGLSIFKGSIKRIPSSDGLKIPHMGWNSLDIKNESGIFKGIKNNSYVYFVHSYYLKAENPEIVSAQTNYGTVIDAAIQYKNVFATQFHPEKSGETGLKILKNFADLTVR